MITFQKLTFANFLSVGNVPVSINLNEYKTTLIHGENGTGKSTILDALTYCLYGKSFRGVNLSQLINTQNRKGCLVECEFSIGKDTFLVRRGMKPRIFETFKNGEIIDNKAADKDNQLFLEQNILKLTYKSFTQIVILGSSNFIPFMQLNAAGRRECVEDFLDIKVFSVMSVLARDRLRSLKEQLRALETNLDAHQFKCQVQQDKVRDMMKRDDKQIESLRSKINQCEVELLKADESIKMWLGDKKVLMEEIDRLAKENPTARTRMLDNVVVKLNTKLERLAKDKSWYREHSECPSCTQPISYELAAIQTGKIQDEIDEVDKASIEAAMMLEKSHEDLNVIQDLQRRVDHYDREIFELQTFSKSYNSQIRDAQQRIDELQNDTVSIEKEEGILLEMNREIDAIKNQKIDLEKQVSNHDVVANLLKDSGIKTQIVKKYLPAMNKFIRHYLTELDFPIQFQLDSEFGEIVNSPLHQDILLSIFL